MIQLEKTSSKVLEIAVFNLDEQLMLFVLQGLAQNKVVSAVELMDEDDNVIQSLKEAGHSDSDYYIKTEIQVTQDGLETSLGSLKIYSKNEIIIDRLQYGVLLIIINSFFKTALLWFIMIYYLRKWLAKPLLQMIDKIDKSDGENIELFNYSFSQRNELSILQEAFNKLILKVRLSNESLNSQRDNLEVEVVNRTQELNKAKCIVEEALSVKTSFLANMSHEVRTPLNGIVGVVHMLEDTKLDPKQKELLNSILSSGDHLLLLLNDVLDLSKIEAGNLTIESVSFNLHKLIEELVFLSSSNGMLSDTKIEIIVQENIPENVIGDVVRIRQILVNFMSNAIKFTDGGKVTLGISGEVVEDHSIELVFKVTDTGIGIHKSDLVKLFDPFHQAETSITRKFGGSGLGLSVCEQVAQVMGGEIGVESKYGTGSTFTFYITLKVDSNSQSDATSDKEAFCELSDFAKHYPQKILLVEDNRLNQKVAQAMFKKLGYSCDIAFVGREALEILMSNNTYTVIFLDLQIPNLDGFTATRKIIERYGADAPNIIAMTANVSQYDRHACESVRMCDFIPKPIKLSSLKKSLKKIS
jgi:signal transduction histidine kinase/CheY-like chemotaxis protein